MINTGCPCWPWSFELQGPLAPKPMGLASKPGGSSPTAEALGAVLEEVMPPAVPDRGVRLEWKPCWWGAMQQASMILLVLTVTVISAFFEGWLHERTVGNPSWTSILRFGTIPMVAAVIAYGTNVLAVYMMFYPLEFVGFFPKLKIGPPLDLFLCGWQGVVPMKAREMAEMSYELMSTKVIRVEELFQRLDPHLAMRALEEKLPNIVSDVINEAGQKVLPKIWEHLPAATRRQLEKRGESAAQPLISQFFTEFKINCRELLDVQHLVVQHLIINKQTLVDIFVQCGKAELQFVKRSGFYLGYILGLIQMVVWMFAEWWWILPISGIFVGYLTNAVGLRVIFWPIEPRLFCFGRLKAHGLFLQRQRAISSIYSKVVAERILTMQNFGDEMCHGVRSPELYKVFAKCVTQSLEDTVAYSKRIFLMSLGEEVWLRFEDAVSAELWMRLPDILLDLDAYIKQALQIEDTIKQRMMALPPADFEKLLHPVFQQEEWKLILIGAVLGALVGLLQALIQTPEQFGICAGC